jgi:predicted SAM-dependent methyltransferase
MTKKWGTKLSNDPMYSPNLTLVREDFSYAFPPRLHEYENNISFNSRVQKALNYVDKNSLGLEIGPSHNPLAMKKDGYKVHILDHASKQQLIAKYMQHNVNTDNIEEVDFVWSGEPLTELIGKESCYEWILASHVIEHTPDLISFLSDCEKLLKNGGILSLIIPDKRYCFDYFNPLTTTGEILDAHYQGRKKPTLGKIFDHFANASLIDGNIAWNKNSNGEISLCHSFDTVKDLILNPNEEYVDVHCWKFVPESFRLILSDLQSLNLMNLNIEKEFDTDGCEFYVTLIKGKEEKINLDRLAKLKKIQIQLASLS